MNLYRTDVTARGGRSGLARSHDERLEVALSVPKELGGDGGPGTNPEQLFAAGYAACFDSALRLVARKQRLELPADATITASVGLTRDPSGLFTLNVILTGDFPGLARETATALMAAAHQVCPYSNATRGNVPVTIRLAGDETAAAIPAPHAAA